ncbi:MAG: hypothetical protein PUC73_12405 [Lachnospiraceae bacterium]|nr:hypothetical protein [Lachnospiraceae bacterium]
MKKPMKEYEVKYPVDESMYAYYGNCESCNNCNTGNCDINVPVNVK